MEKLDTFTNRMETTSTISTSVTDLKRSHPGFRRSKSKTFPRLSVVFILRTGSVSPLIFEEK